MQHESRVLIGGGDTEFQREIYAKISIMPPAFLAMYSRHGQLLRFFISGGMAFFANIGVMYVLTDRLAVWYLVSSIFAFIGSFVVSFSMQKYWTFKNREADRMSQQLRMSLVLAVANLGINTVLMYLFVDYVHLHYLAAVVCSAGLIAIETYFIYKYIIFTPSSYLQT